ncbi:hypothetical protein DY000_02039795 [Brassica cretica]|uniref:Ubiquitin-like protease family profile domain-containing protein n=1 Tax=Brassica cretica TaxID=69181 RepID=A0ABQ7B5W1_BRACR|nr:hypothetical protein DY000_02039795 [Brassica cretica]
MGDGPAGTKEAENSAICEEAAAEASEEVTTTVGGLTKEDIKTMFKDIADAMREGFGTCLKEIKYLSERVEAVEKKVGITTKRKGTSSQNTTSPPKPTLEPGSESVNGTNAGKKSLTEDKGPDVPAAVPANASSSKDKAPEPSLVLLDKNQLTSDRTRKLAGSQQSPYTANNTARVIISSRKLYPGYNPFAPIDKKKLKELADWLKTCPHYRTSVDKKPLNFANTHWIAMWISIPKRHIVVFDSICSSISPEELDVVMEPFLYMVPYLLVECASSDEKRAQYSLEPFTYEIPTNIPPARAGQREDYEG